MSTTPEQSDFDFTATLIAEALIAEASRSTGHRRLYLTGHLGLAPQPIFDKLREYLEPDARVTVTSRTTALTLQAVPLGDGPGGPLLVPYLVGEAGPNSGSAGFAAFLRDEVPQGPSPRVLLVLDQRPVETVRTAAEDASQLPALQWPALLRAAVFGANPDVLALLRAVVQDDEQFGRLDRHARSVGALRRLSTLATAEAAGAALDGLGAYLSDPRAYTNAKQRLRSGATWRERLQSWSAPDQDLRGRLAPRYPDTSDDGLARVVAARTPFGLDYSLFQLDDMPVGRGANRPLRLASPLRTRGAGAASLRSRAAVWLPGGGSFAVLLAEPADRAAAATIAWADGGQAVSLPIAAGDSELAIEVVGSGWRFARLELPTGERADLAVFLDPGQWAPFEAGLDLDVTASAFRCADQPHLLAMGPSGQLVGQPEILSPSDMPTDGEPHVFTTGMAGQQQRIDLIVTGSSGVAAPDDDAGEGPAQGTPADGGDDGDQADPEGGGTAGPELNPDDADDADPPTDPTGSLPAASVPHARLQSSDGEQHMPTSSLLVTDEGRVFISPGGYCLLDQELAAGVDGVALEQLILASPEATAFDITRSQGDISLERHSYLDRLDLGGLDGALTDAFFDARRALFDVLRPHKTAHAIGAGIGVDEARRYVDTYEALLEGILPSARFQAEYERIALVDAVTDPLSGDLYLAPTNPVTVSWLLQFSSQVEQWLPRASELLRADLNACSPRHLVPCFALQGTWFETGATAPLLWRRYRPQTRENPGDHRPGYIARRIEHFLHVHPEHRDPRQLLSLAFYEPGDGEAVLLAMRRLARKASQEADAASLPRLQVTIISSSDMPTALQEVVSGNAESAASDAAVDRLLRDRVSVRRAAPGEGVPAFAHLSFVFRSSLEREPETIELSARASTLYAAGLAAAPGRHTTPGRNETTFHWGTFSGPGETAGLPTLVRKTLELVGGMPRDVLADGRTRMPSTRVGSAFMGDLYDRSAWVVHLDKLLGLEAFAPDASGRQARYLIDYEDRADPAQPGLDAITATARVAPYRLALRQALAELGRPTEAALDRLLQLFNGVSGRWALDLVGANPTALHERIGLAAAIASLHDLDGVLAEDDAVGLVVPLEEVLDALPLGARPGAGRLCDDLLYVRISTDTERPVLRGRLLEVKYRQSTDAAAPSIARQQLQKAHQWLLDTFNDKDTPSRLFRSRDLAELLRGSATRSAAFGLITDDRRRALEGPLDAVMRGEFDLDLSYVAGESVLQGDFISIEADSAVPAHRQALVGDGLALGHLRLGRAALEALVSGRPMARPDRLPRVSYPAPIEADADQSPADADSSPADVTTSESPSPTTQSTATAHLSSAEVPIIAARLDAAFSKYGLSVEPFSVDLVQVGPSLMRFRTRTLGRLSISEVERRSRDIGREIASPGEVQVGDAPGFVTVDVPRSEREAVPLSRMLAALDGTQGQPGALRFAAGIAPSGEVRIEDLSRLPHLLVAGATGSGKSVFLRGMLIEMLRSRTPDQLSLLIIDPKRLDFAAFARAPHLRGGRIIHDPDEALETLTHTLEMELTWRQPILEQAGVSSASEFYENGGTLDELPQVVILVDEFADLVLSGSNPRAFSELVQRYAQLTRAYGIFLVLATQRPSVDVVTGSIKANLTARMAFSLPSARDSMTVLDKGGAEDLLGNGDLLFYRNGRTERLQAPLTTVADVREVVP